MKKFQLALLLFVMTTQSGCSLFFGNIRPVEEKSSTYGILDLSKANPVWQKVGATPGHFEENKDSPDSGVSDTAYQSQITASVISINSACRENQSPSAKKDLSELSRELLLGISDISLRDEAKRVLEHVPALVTTVKGQLNSETVMLRTVVLQKGSCVYDLMFVSRPEHFAKDEKDFENFVSSLKLK